MDDMQPWVRHDRATLMQRRFFTVNADEVTHPGGGRITYDWVDAPDMVRVAAVTDTGELLIIRQAHYLPEQTLWQLPGGGVSVGESPEQSARRELLEETGYTASTWTHLGHVWPLPGLTAVRVHLFHATGLGGDGRQDLEDSEADVTVLRVPLHEAVKATMGDGLLRCAPSAALTLAVAAAR